jgi:hypothetical protein
VKGRILAGWAQKSPKPCDDVGFKFIPPKSSWLPHCHPSPLSKEKVQTRMQPIWILSLPAIGAAHLRAGSHVPWSRTA